MYSEIMPEITQKERNKEMSDILIDQLGREFFGMIGANKLVYGDEKGISFLQFRFKIFSQSPSFRA